MKKIIVSKEACIGCGACVAIDPEHFEFNDEGLSQPISNENLESSELASAIDSCPTSAISLGEQENNVSETENCTCDDTCECENCSCDDTCECEECDCTPENNCGCIHTEEE